MHDVKIILIGDQEVYFLGRRINLHARLSANDAQKLLSIVTFIVNNAALDIKELAAKDGQHAQLEMPPFDEMWDTLGYDNSDKCIGFSVYEAVRRHFKRVR